MVPPSNAAASPQPSTAPNGKPVVNHKGEFVEPAQVVAIVGGQSILAGDMAAEINQMRNRVKGQVSDDEFEEQRPILMRQLLQQRINTMLVYQDFLRQIPEERHADLMANLSKQFNQKQLYSTMEKQEVQSVTELDAKLRENGSSLQRLKREFTEHVIAQEMIRKSSTDQEEITHEEMLTYYHEHIGEYEFPAKAEWEELCTEFRHYRSEEAAKKDIVQMGNEVLRGAPLGAVARRSQQGPQSEEGGKHDWTTQGSLRSSPIDEAIFSIPIGKLSKIIRDEEGFHIIRVIDRTEAGRTPFTEAQVGIKEEIRKTREQTMLQEYLVELRENTPIWTIFDEDDGSRPSPSRLSRPVDSRTTPPR